MKNFLRSIFIVVLGSNLAFAQPELVSDFNAGAAGGISEFNNRGHYIGDVIVLPVIDSEFGEELGVLKDGELQLLKDLNPGAADGSPRGFVTYDSLLYFIADDTEAEEVIWSTDGTEAGTQQVFLLPEGEELFWNLIPSEEAGLFFATFDSLYRSPDGITYEGILSNVELRDPLSNPNSTYCLFDGGIAFLRDRSQDEELQLWAFKDSLELLGIASYPTILYKYRGLTPVSDGLIFTLEGSFTMNEGEGIYGYVAESGSLDRIPNAPPALAHLALSSNRALFFGDGDFYVVNSAAGPAEVIISDVEPGVQFNQIPHAAANNRSIFLSDDPFAEDLRVSQTAGSIFTTSTVATLEVPNFSNFLAFDRFVFFANGTFNGFEANIYYVDTENPVAQLIYAYPDGVTGFRSVQPIGVQNGKLYFASDVDDTVGRELYALDTGIDDLVNSTEYIDNGPQPELQFAGEHFSLAYGEDLPVRVSAYDLNGRLIRQWDTRTNQTEKVVPGKGLLVYVAQVGKKQIVRKYFYR